MINQQQVPRYTKSAVPHAPDSRPNHQAAISVQVQDPVDEARQLAEMLLFLGDSGVISGYGQAALLLHSVRDAVGGPYRDGLERAGVPSSCEPAGHVNVPAGTGCW